MSETTTTASKQTTHPLTGLEPDNLLAFLALLGLLRALDIARPEWQARAAWRGTPLEAMLYLASDVSRTEIVAEADAAIHSLRGTYDFGDKKDPRYTSDEFREVALHARSESERARLVAALASDGAVNRRSGEVERTPLCTMLGQGHQHFLSRLTAMSERSDPANDRADLERALFEPWRYEDESDSFRWDPSEDRRYAHQSGDPSERQNKLGTVTGANRLAAIGLAAFTSVPTASGLVTLGFSGARRAREVCWPLVSVPANLTSHVALLAHPSLGDEQRASDLSHYGVRAVARARRYQVGKYFNFERARLQFL
jgi:hypothetical protein